MLESGPWSGQRCSTTTRLYGRPGETLDHGLTLAWLASLAGFAWWIFGLGMEGWADQHSNSGVHRPEYQRDAALAGGGFLIIFPGEPVVIAMVALREGPPRHRHVLALAAVT